jgi:pimeloyl-ACP methyl ester carboxylesterase
VPIAEVNGTDIAYDTRGPAGAPAIVLIMGLGTQMTAWPDPFCDALAGAAIKSFASTTVTSGCRRRLRVAVR